MNYRADYHTHTIFSLDSEVPTEDMVRQALKNGFSEICITEHKDLDPLYHYTEYFNYSVYRDWIEAVKDGFSDKIRVKIGVELDFQTETAHSFADYANNHHFDFILGSVHALEHQFVGRRFFYTHDPQLAYRDYFMEVLSLSRMDCFDVVGHLDYIKRFGWEFAPLKPENYKKLLEEILSNLIKGGRGIEINTGGWRHAPGEPYPSPYILKMYRQMGGEIITIGSDAHRLEDQGKNWDEAANILKSVGFDGIYVFTERKPEKILFD